MKLYIYKFSKIKGRLVTLEELEVEEKAKTYTVVNGGWRRRIDKCYVDCTSGYSNDEVVILEKDFDKAKKIYLAHLQKEIIAKKESLQNLNKYYQDICDLEGVE